MVGRSVVKWRFRQLRRISRSRTRSPRLADGSLSIFTYLILTKPQPEFLLWSLPFPHFPVILLFLFSFSFKYDFEYQTPLLRFVVYFYVLQVVLQAFFVFDANLLHGSCRSSDSVSRLSVSSLISADLLYTYLTVYWHGPKIILIIITTLNLSTMMVTMMMLSADIVGFSVSGRWVDFSDDWRLTPRGPNRSR